MRPEDVSYPPGAEALPGVWLEARGMLRSVLETTTFADLVERSQKLAAGGTRPGGHRAVHRIGTVPMDLKPVYLICGSDWPKVDAAMARLRARFQEESIEQLSIGDEGVDVVAACNALDLLGGPRLVLVRGAEALSEDEAGAIADYLQSPTPETCLALFGGAGIDPKSAPGPGRRSLRRGALLRRPRSQAGRRLGRQAVRRREGHLFRSRSPGGWWSSSARTWASSRPRSKS